MVNLSRNAFTETDPAWSPNAQQIAFSSNRGKGSDIYIMNIDGSGLRQLTNDGFDDRRPRWSPDGKKIAFESGRDGLLPGIDFSARYSDIFVMDVDGSHVTNITKTPGNSESWASWAPDGKTILYTRNLAPQVFMLVNPDGTNARPFHAVDPRYTDDVASWSPDGSRIAYSAFDKQHPEFTDVWYIFTAKADGTEAKQLTVPSTRFPAWSPDGTRIVYNRDGGNEFWARFGIVDIWVVNADGTNNTRLTNDNGRRNEIGGPQAWAK
jgi:TolB protein